MAQYLTIYALCHQPRRIKLPAEGIEPGAAPAAIEAALFDEAANRFYFQEVATYCYHPAMQLWRRLLDAGMALGLGVSVSFLKQAEAWDERLLDRLRQLAAHPQCELVAVEPYHSFLPLIDLPHFQQRMRWGDAYVESLLGARPRVADTTEMLMSDAIYTTLGAAGYEAAFLDGREWVLGWRQPTHLYHGGRRRRAAPADPPPRLERRCRLSLFQPGVGPVPAAGTDVGGLGGPSRRRLCVRLLGLRDLWRAPHAR